MTRQEITALTAGFAVVTTISAAVTLVVGCMVSDTVNDSLRQVRREVRAAGRVGRAA